MNFEQPDCKLSLMCQTNQKVGHARVDSDHNKRDHHCTWLQKSVQAPLLSMTRFGFESAFCNCQNVLYVLKSTGGLLATASALFPTRRSRVAANCAYTQSMKQIKNNRSSTGTTLACADYKHTSLSSVEFSNAVTFCELKLPLRLRLALWSSGNNRDRNS